MWRGMLILSSPPMFAVVDKVQYFGVLLVDYFLDRLVVCLAEQSARVFLPQLQ